MKAMLPDGRRSDFIDYINYINNENFKNKGLFLWSYVKSYKRWTSSYCP
jgi:hypothetical protein